MKKTAYILTILILSAALAEASIKEVTVGMSKAEMIKEMGPPKGEANAQGVQMVFYDGGEIELRDGKVSRIAPKFEQRARERKEAAKRAQQSNGLMDTAKKKVDGFMTWAKTKVGADPTQAAAGTSKAAVVAAPPPPSVDPVKVLKQGGQQVPLDTVLVSGQVTIVDFYADWCGPCRRISPKLELLAKQDSGVVLRKVDIVRWGTPVAEQYNIDSIPHIRVYDASGKLIGKPTSDFNQLVKNVALAK